MIKLYNSKGVFIKEIPLAELESNFSAYSDFHIHDSDRELILKINLFN
jgi:hypothetical protein